MLSQPRVIASISIYSWRVLTVCIFPDYEAFANSLRNIDKNPSVAVTIWQGELRPPLLSFHFELLSATGKWFCSGTDVKARGNTPAEMTIRSAFVPGVALTHLDTSKAVGRVVRHETTSSLPL